MTPLVVFYIVGSIVLAGFYVWLKQSGKKNRRYGPSPFPSSGSPKHGET